MNNEIKLFNNQEFGEIRTIIIDGNPWFILKDLMIILGLTNVTELRKRLNKKGLSKTEVLTKGGKQSLWAVNESNMYKCVLRSNKKVALEFENWITEEVLPMIRKTGAYITDSVWDQITNDPAKFGEFLIDYEKTYTVTEIAKELGVSSVRILNQILFKDHINIISSIYKMEHGCYILAYNRSI